MSLLALKKYYRSLAPLVDRRTLAQGPDWDRIFGRLAPRELEIGFGNGEYIHRASLASPERDFIGLEIAWASVKRALRRLAEPKRNNVRLICLPAKPALELLFPPLSLDLIRVLFPIPWPKEAHESRRLFSGSFLNIVANRLKTDGLFYLVTDDRNLAFWTLEQSKSSGLAVTLTEKSAELNTKYERKWSSGGQDIFYHLEGRPKAIIPESYCSLKIMHPTFLDSLEPDKYKPHGQSGLVTVIFGDFFYDPVRREGFLKTKVAEEQFVQEFFIRLAPQPDGRWKLSPAVFGQALPTEGVQTALNLAACPK
jgi:tRNA (guanine-N7-)-methyltransferase